MSKRIFISKNASEIDPFRSQFEELGFTVLGHSFLSFSPVEFDIKHDYDALFFSSVRSVIFFQAYQSIPFDKSLACIGDKTAELLETLGHTVDFKGTKSGAPKVVAEEFKAWLASNQLSQRVLFPISDRSLKSIATEIPAAQKEEVIVYSTAVVGKVIEECDVYVLTSPSNVEGFFEFNTVPAASRVIAWGKSTEAALVARAVEVEFCLEKSAFQELMEYLS